MADSTNLYVCHQCGAEWTASTGVLQLDDCAQCGQSSLIPEFEEVRENEDSQADSLFTEWVESDPNADESDAAENGWNES